MRPGTAKSRANSPRTSSSTRTGYFRILGPFHDRGTSWGYDPMPSLRQVAAPQLWVLAAADREAPYEETLRRLEQLQREGRPIVTAVFPARITAYSSLRNATASASTRVMPRATTR